MWLQRKIDLSYDSRDRSRKLQCKAFHRAKFWKSYWEDFPLPSMDYDENTTLGHPATWRIHQAENPKDHMATSKAEEKPEGSADPQEQESGATG